MTAPDVHEAAALWGSAENSAYSLPERFNFALGALQFFGTEYEKREDLTAISVVMSVPAYDTMGPSVSLMTEQYIADLVQRYPEYHFFLAEVSL